MQEITIQEYYSVPSTVTLGTRGSYGRETLHIIFGPGWAGLEKVATWRAGEPAAVECIIPPDGVVPVPHEATGTPGVHLLVIRGMDSGVDLYTCNIRYNVLDRAKTGGGSALPPTPDVLQQYIQGTKEDRLAAEQAAVDARKGAETALDAADDAWEAVEHYPIIRDDTWWIWQGDPNGSGCYIDTGQPARGPMGHYVAATNAQIDAIMQL